MVNLTHNDFLIRNWQPDDRQVAADLIKSVLEEYGLGWEVNCGTCTDQDAVEIEKYYWQTGGAFWVIERAGQIVGTAGYYPIKRQSGIQASDVKAVEIRKMYLHPSARGQGLGKFLLNQLEQAIAAQDFSEIWIETATVLKEAVLMYEKYGYQPEDRVDTPRCDKVYRKIL